MNTWIKIFTVIFLMYLIGCKYNVSIIKRTDSNFPIETTKLDSSVVQGIYHGKTNLKKDPLRLMIEGKNEVALERIKNFGENKKGGNQRNEKRGKEASKQGNAYKEYYKAVYYAHNNQLDQSWDAICSAIGLGLPFETFMAGPRSLLQNIYSYPQFQEAVKDRQLIHGPMVSAVSSESVKIWARTWDEVSFAVHLSTAREFLNPLYSNKVRTLKENDYTAVTLASNLKPDTRYYYKIELDGNLHDEVYSFKTYPVENKPAHFEIAFGGCSNLNSTPKNEIIWNRIMEKNPLAFVQLGDNTYIDDPTGYEHQRANFYRRHSNLDYRGLMASISNYAIYDDHDFSINDGVSSSDPDLPSWKLKVLKIFKENFLAPYYGNGKKNGGAYTNFSIADVDFFILDGRYFRENPLITKNPTMLGEDQKKWLFNLLKSSSGKFKIIFTSVPFASHVSGKEISDDAWDGYPEEREEIYRFIRENNIPGVVFIAGDRHRADARKIKITGNYDIYEFLNSRLTNDKGYQLVEQAEGSEYIFGYNALPHFGTLTFDTKKEDPELTYKVINNRDEEVASVTIYLSELTNR